MKYYVGDIAKLLGITPGALRFYEDQKIIATKKTENGRRYYNLSDIMYLLSVKKYSSMGIPLKNIVNHFNEKKSSHLTIGKSLHENALKVAEEAEYCNHLSEVISDYAKQIDDIDRLNGRFEIYTRPEFYSISAPDGQLISKDKKLLDVIAQWVQGIPATRYAFLEEKGKTDDTTNAYISYIISSNHARRIGVPVSHPAVRLIPEGVCLRTVVELDVISRQQENIFLSMRECFSKNNLNYCGVSIATVIIVEITPNRQYKSYLEVTAPFNLPYMESGSFSDK